MPAYARKTTVDEEFGTKRGPDGVIVCDSCNRNLAEHPLETVYVIYSDKNQVKNNAPHGIYCENCLSGFPKRVMI